MSGGDTRNCAVPLLFDGDPGEEDRDRRHGRRHFREEKCPQSSCQRGP
ncbi:hypothetical protein OCGS_0419 [Oceaniovalibus guishaninsula JLT2003]|uniref:Uncharacterized protein n=1 Tax=Oceaniovalibus guishaninsula JLT2003 TaxID=1231392 RepID=K2HRE3_9RHOB|nr:hypothetical protein OCGS_0419 [Oceaniovalibus guishaninsula JLT2003]